MTTAPLRHGQSSDRQLARLAAEPHTRKATRDLSLQLCEKHPKAVSRAASHTTRGHLDPHRGFKTRQGLVGCPRSHTPQPLLNDPPVIETPTQTWL